MSAERQIAGLCRQKPSLVVQAICLSGLVWVGLMAEFWLCLRFFGTAASFIQAFGLLTVARLAFLTPLPGALGALEAGQVFAFSALGFPAAAAIALSLFVRTRDVSLGVLGLVVGGRLASPKQPLNRFSSIIGKDGFL